MITKAAIKYKGKVYTGERHSHILSDADTVHGLGFGGLKLGKQGFVNHKGTFLTRDEAAVEAFRCRQIKRMPEKVLTSEDLW